MAEYDHLGREQKREERSRIAKKNLEKRREARSKKARERRVFRELREQLEDDRRIELETEVSLDAVIAAEEAGIRSKHDGRSLKERRRDARERMLPRDRRCQYCRHIVLKSKSWVIAGKAKCCLSCYRNDPQARAAITSERSRGQWKCSGCKRTLQRTSRKKNTSQGVLCLSCYRKAKQCQAKNDSTRNSSTD